MSNRRLDANEVVTRARPAESSWWALATRAWQREAYYYYYALLGDGLLGAAQRRA
jgi:hypothetical protein